MRTRGFTLIELLIVVAIIGIIAAIAIPNLLVALHKGRQKSTMGDMTSIGAAIESYLVDWAFAPAAGETLITGLDRPWFRPFYIKILPDRDGWNTLFAYNAGGGSAFDAYSVISWGRNKVTDNTPVGQYPLRSLSDFNQDIIYSDGRFTVLPNTKQ